MDNAGLSGKQPKPPASTPDDIPVAVRETAATGTDSRTRQATIALAVGLGALALLAGGWFAYQSSRADSTANNSTVPNATTASPNSASPSPTSSANTLLGHYAYSEAPQSELQAITPDGGIKLRKAAARAFLAMTAAAQAEGLSLVPISGFRSLNDQDYLFFDVKAQRGQGPKTRAQVSAPPGYSEHHTGYAVDIGDGNTPATNLSPSFEKTAAYRWLQANAAHYSFELSFPKGNRQGVSYEPWHWRYVGDRQSLETFYKARSNR